MIYHFEIYELPFTNYHLRITIYELQFTIYELRFMIYNLRFFMLPFQGAIETMIHLKPKALPLG